MRKTYVHLMLKSCLRAFACDTSSQGTIPPGPGLVKKTCAEALQGQKRRNYRKRIHQLLTSFPLRWFRPFCSGIKKSVPVARQARFLSFTQTFSFRRHPDMIDETMVCTQVFFTCMVHCGRTKRWRAPAKTWEGSFDDHLGTFTCVYNSTIPRNLRWPGNKNANDASCSPIELNRFRAPAEGSAPSR